MAQQAGLYKLFSCLMAILTLGLWVSANAHQDDSRRHASVCESAQSCKASAEDVQEPQQKAKSLLQLSHEHKVVETDKRHTSFNFYNGSNPTTTMAAERPITFITILDPYFKVNLGTSLLWKERLNKPHQWILIDNSENQPITKVYAKAQAAAAHDLLVFLHSDILLPDDFYENFMHKLWLIQEHDINWGVLGVVGVPYGEFRSNSSITDFAGTYQTNSDILRVQGVDECLFVLKSDSPRFDHKLPGFDLYGMDIVLAARKKGQMSYLLNVPVFHKLRGIDGKVVTEESFNAKVDSPEYILRVDRTARYFQEKWCNSGHLPVMGPSFRVECGAWCKVIDMLNRSHHNETCVDPTGEFPTGHLTP